MPWLPEGLALSPLEGAGEVQTPLHAPSNVRLAIGDVVFFRHAKAGELAEHFAEYLLVPHERYLVKLNTLEPKSAARGSASRSGQNVMNRTR